MLIISRHRQEDDTETAKQLAAKFNTTVLSIPLLYDFPADSPVIQRLRSLPEPAYFLVPLAERAVKNILNHLQIPYAEVFETKDDVQIPDGGINGGQVERIDEFPNPRWYPVVDNTKCTACLECVNYCLFGVYAIGSDSLPFVDQPDACRDGCPACARVCPSQAIMFPLYEDQTIAGYKRDLADNLNDLIDLVDQI
jgi:NAD-dependent dihydropyrimidine dehydrogenase PreA subunit